MGARILGNIVEKMGNQAEGFRAVELKWEVLLLQEHSRLQIHLSRLFILFHSAIRFL